MKVLTAAQMREVDRRTMELGIPGLILMENAGHRVVEFLDLTTKSMGLNVLIEQVPVAQGSEFASKSLKQMQIRRDTGVIVLAIRRASGEMIFNPPAEAVLQGGDCLVAMGGPENLQKLERTLAEVKS